MDGVRTPVRPLWPGWSMLDVTSDRLSDPGDGAVDSNDMVKARIEEVLLDSPVRPAISAVEVLEDEDDDGDRYLRVNLHLRSGVPALLDEVTPKLGKLKSDVHLAISDIDRRYSVIRFTEDA